MFLVPLTAKRRRSHLSKEEVSLAMQAMQSLYPRVRKILDECNKGGIVGFQGGSKKGTVGWSFGLMSPVCETICISKVGLMEA